MNYMAYLENDWLMNDDEYERYIEHVNCTECDAEFVTDRYESTCPDCMTLININRAHA